MGNKKLWADEAKKLLIEYELLKEKHNSLGSCVQLNKDIFAEPLPTRRLAARLRAEKLCIQALLDWLRLQGMVTAHKATIRGDSTPAQFGFYAWDLVAPSYLHSLASQVEKRLVGGFVVADVCLGKTLTTADIQYFLNKVIAASSPFNRPFISFLVGQFFDIEALRLGRQHGIMLTTPSNLFGTDFGRILEEVVELLDTPDWQSEQQALEMMSLLDKISHYEHLEGVMGNVLADTFEMFVAHCNALDWGRPMFGRKFKSKEGMDFDCDVLFKKQGKGTLGIECKKKNRRSLVSADEIVHWFNDVVPLIYAENQSDRYFKDVRCEFSVWTNSDFHESAIAFLQECKSKRSRVYDISWCNGDGMKNILRKAQDKKLVDAFKQYFSN